MSTFKWGPLADIPRNKSRPARMDLYGCGFNNLGQVIFEQGGNRENVPEFKLIAKGQRIDVVGTSWGGIAYIKDNVLHFNAKSVSRIKDNSPPSSRPASHSGPDRPVQNFNDYLGDVRNLPASKFTTSITSNECVKAYIDPTASALMSMDSPIVAACIVPRGVEDTRITHIAADGTGKIAVKATQGDHGALGSSPTHILRWYKSYDEFLAWYAARDLQFHPLTDRITGQRLANTSSQTQPRSINDDGSKIPKLVPLSTTTAAAATTPNQSSTYSVSHTPSPLSLDPTDTISRPPTVPVSLPSSHLTPPIAEILKDLVDLVASNTAFMALTSDGKVHTWGSPLHPEALARPVTHDTTADRPHLVPQLEKLNVIKIAACNGGTIMGVVTETGDCYLWGITNAGGMEELLQTGQQTFKPAIEALTNQDPLTGLAKVELPCVHGAYPTVINLAIGSGHILIVDDSRRVWAAGEGGHGQLGCVKAGVFAKDWILVPGFTDKRVIDVFCGDLSSYVLVDF